MTNDNYWKITNRDRMYHLCAKIDDWCLPDHALMELVMEYIEIRNGSLHQELEDARSGLWASLEMQAAFDADNYIQSQEEEPF